MTIVYDPKLIKTGNIVLVDGVEKEETLADHMKQCNGCAYCD